MPPPTPTLESFNLLAPHYEASTGGCTRALARHIISFLPNMSATSHILDNACGTGIVAQELVTKHLSSHTPMPRITSIDGATNMLELARQSLQDCSVNDRLAFETMPAENLAFADEQFTHSTTNLGILFFADGARAARELYRTLRPGGTAVVTSWGELGYVRTIHEAQEKGMPGAPLLRVPVAEVWFDERHLGNVLREAGFEVEVHTHQVYYVGRTVKDVGAGLGLLMAILKAGWSEEVRGEFERELEGAVERDVVKIQRQKVDEKEGEMEDLLGIATVALVAVAKK